MGDTTTNHASESQVSYHIITKNADIIRAANSLEMNVNDKSEYINEVTLLLDRISMNPRALCRNETSLFDKIVEGMYEHRNTYLYAEKEGVIIGIADFNVYKHIPPTSMIYISHICTSAGGGRQLLNEIKKLSIQLKIYRIELFPLAKVIGFYVKMGFAEIEGKEDEYFLNLQDSASERISDSPDTKSRKSRKSRSNHRSKSRSNHRSKSRSKSRSNK